MSHLSRPGPQNAAPVDKPVFGDRLVDHFSLHGAPESRSQLDFGQFSLLGNGRFAGISDAGENFRTVPGEPGTH
jgi:hypothetical protein